MSQNETQFRIGQLLDESAERDAIHIAVLPVIAHNRISPGARVRLLPGSTDRVTLASGPNDDWDGVADPFLPHTIKKGERFYMFVRPNTVTGMRHHWSHPRVDQAPKREKSEIWLRQFADRWHMDYEEMIATATAGGRDLVAGTLLQDEDDLEPGEYQAFWSHLEVLTGRRFDVEHRDSVGWRCAC